VLVWKPNPVSVHISDIQMYNIVNDWINNGFLNSRTWCDSIRSVWMLEHDVSMMDEQPHNRLCCEERIICEDILMKQDDFIAFFKSAAECYVDRGNQV